MSFAVEQQAWSQVSGYQWLRIAGPYETRGEAERVVARHARRQAAVRIVEVKG